MEGKWGAQQRGTEGERERERQRRRGREKEGGRERGERECAHISMCRHSANCYLTFESTLLILFWQVQAVTIRWWQRLWTTQVHTRESNPAVIHLSEADSLASFSRAIRAAHANMAWFRCWAHGKPVLPSFLYSLPSPWLRPLLKLTPFILVSGTNVTIPGFNPSWAHLQRNHLTVWCWYPQPQDLKHSFVSHYQSEQSWSFPGEFQALSSPPETHLSHFFSEGFLSH